ncbi:MAG: HD-GYP domain-containing protein [Thermoleophilaceae bacterium]|nr:HD-GYP domain-containing protein [Thermoleophilaceae bacterium]
MNTFDPLAVQTNSPAFDLSALLSPDGAYTPRRNTRELLARVSAALFVVAGLAAALYASTQDVWNLALAALALLLVVGVVIALTLPSAGATKPRMLGLFWVSVASILAATYAFDIPDLLLLMLLPMMLVACLFWHDRVTVITHLGAACVAFCIPMITGDVTDVGPKLIVTLPTFLAVAVIAGTLADRFRVLRGSERERFKATIEALSTALTARDGYTGSHSQETLTLVRAVCDELMLDEYAVDYVCDVALLHDIGKIGIPNDVLNAPGKLDDQQWATMMEHPVIGERIVGTVPGLEDVARAIRHEHEHWDGSGYPDGLTQGTIPLASRIVLVCDAFHAMTSDRPYRQAMGETAARQELAANAGTQFDPVVVGALLQVLDRSLPGMGAITATRTTPVPVPAS